MRTIPVRARWRSAWLLVAALLLLAGCASVALAPPAEDVKAKSMEAPAGKALIYIYRNETMGAAVKMNVMFNGKLLGQTASETYFLVATPPGKVTVTSLAENTSELSLDVSAGKKYYVWQEVKMGTWSAGSALSEKSATEGMKGVNECKLIQYVEM